MVRLTLAVVAALAVAAPAATASTTESSGRLRVFFPRDCEHNVYKPRSFVVTCADANFVVRRVRYRSYGSRRATGRGTAYINDCKPNCAEGKFRRYPVSFVLSRVRECGDVPQFRRLRVRFTGRKPAGEDRSTRVGFDCGIPPS